MSIRLDVQIASNDVEIPNEADFKLWADSVPSDSETSACLRIVDEPEAQSLNKQYRKIDKATNVLSFSADLPDQLEIKFLGDIVICAPIVRIEAKNYCKELKNHWAHLLVHGILHLQGYDHDGDSDAEKMETMEIEILNKLEIPNPYEPL